MLRVVSGPIVLVGPSYRGNGFRCHGPMLVAVSDDPHSHTIIPTAEAFALTFDYELEVVTVRRRATATPRPAGSRRLADAAAQEVGAPVRSTVLVDDDPATALVDHAERTGAALIAMATTNPTGLKRLLLGSTSAAVLRAAPCPVVMVRPAR